MKFEAIKNLPPDLQVLALEMSAISAALVRVEVIVGEIAKDLDALVHGLKAMDAELDKAIADPVPAGNAS